MAHSSFPDRQSPTHAGRHRRHRQSNVVALSSVANFAIDEGYWEENPVLPRLIKERHNPIVLPRPEDVAKVIARAPGLRHNDRRRTRHRSPPGRAGRRREGRLDRAAKRMRSLATAAFSHSATSPFRRYARDWPDRQTHPA